MPVIFWQEKKSLHFTCVLRLCYEVEFKDGELINWVEEISREPNVEAVPWILLGAFIQINSEYCRKNIMNDLKLSLERKGLQSWGKEEHYC